MRINFTGMRGSRVRLLFATIAKGSSRSLESKDDSDDFSAPIPIRSKCSRSIIIYSWHTILPSSHPRITTATTTTSDCRDFSFRRPSLNYPHHNFRFKKYHEKWGSDGTQLDLHANSFLRANALPCVEMIDLAGLINPHAMVKGMILCTVRWRGWCEGVFDQNSHYSAQYIRRKSKYTQFFKRSSTLQSAHYSLMVCKKDWGMIEV